MSFNIAEGKAQSQRINKAQARKLRNEQLEAYAEYRAEARACGYDVESFDEYIGISNAVDNRVFELSYDYAVCPHSHLDA